MSIIENFRDNLKTVKANKYYSNFNKKLKQGIKDGIIRKFDDNFFAQFNNQYFGGLPVYYYLYRMNVGKCYDCSAILALALGKESKVCRGNLKNMAIANKENSFGHGWVEKDGVVYDTTWQIICDKKTYYDLMGITNPSVVSSSKFFKDCKDISNWEIHDKAYYENNYEPFASILIFQVQEIEKMILNSPTQTIEQGDNYRYYFSKYNSTIESKEFAKKVLKDLPDTSKVQSSENELTM